MNNASMADKATIAKRLTKRSDSTIVAACVINCNSYCPRHFNLKFRTEISAKQLGRAVIFEVIVCHGWSCLSLQWCHKEHDGVSNHHPRDCLLNHLFRRRWKKTSMLCITGLRVGISPVTGEFPAQRAGDTENASIWWRHHVRGSAL